MRESPLKPREQTARPKAHWLHQITQSRWAADASLVIVALIWGVNMPMMKYALERMDEYLFNFARLSFSTILLGVLVIAQRHRVLDKSESHTSIKRQLLNILVFSALAGFAYQLFFMLGMRATSAGNTALILSTMPLWAALLALLFLNERLSRFAWLGLAIALAGTLIVTLSKDEGRIPGTLAGNILVIVAAFSWALASVVSRPMMRSITPLALAFCGVSIALPAHFALALSNLGELVEMVQDPLLFGAVAFSGIFSTGVAYALYNFSVRQLGTAHATAYQNLVPIIALVAAWWMIGEIPYRMQLVGGFLIISGLLIMRYKRTNMAIELLANPERKP